MSDDFFVKCLMICPKSSDTLSDDPIKLQTFRDTGLALFLISAIRGDLRYNVPHINLSQIQVQSSPVTCWLASRAFGSVARALWELWALEATSRRHVIGLGPEQISNRRGINFCWTNLSCDEIMFLYEACTLHGLWPGAITTSYGDRLTSH